MNAASDNLMNAAPDRSTPAQKRILVVISADQAMPSAPGDSVLLERALSVAQATHSELEILHVCHEPGMGSSPWTDDELQLEKQKVVDRNATLIAELLLRLNAQGVQIRQDVRWDRPRSEAILRKVHEVRPDLVMKQSRRHDYVMGLLSNTDWDLIRQSPADVWFVTEGKTEIQRIIAAVGSNAHDEKPIASTDHDLLEVAALVADGFGAQIFPVHTYQVPEGLSMYAAYAPERSLAGSALPISTARERSREIAGKQARTIEAFAQQFDLDPERVQIAEGHPRHVLPEIARSLNAGLIVMGARNLSWWERLFKSVSAEPVLAKAPCDVLFVKDDNDVQVPASAGSLIQGEPVLDLEQAIIDPMRTFGSPERLVRMTDLSGALRAHILQAWEQDIRAQMAEENEGGTVKATNVDLLTEIRFARSRLEVESGQSGKSTTRPTA